MRTFGIEIEGYNVNMATLANELNAAGIACAVEGYNHNLRHHWKVVSDASINGSYGFELVSPPLAGEDGYRQIQVVSEVLNRLGAKVNTSTGLHVHHDARDLSLTAWKNLCRLYVKYENQLDSVMPVSRRGNNNRYIKSLANAGSVDRLFAKLAAAQDLAAVRDAMGQSYDRYYKLNLTSYLRHGTVEFRQHSGTIEAEKIIAWVKLTADMVACAVAAKTINAKGGDKFDNLFTLNAEYRVNRELKAFYTSRRAALAVAA